MRMEASSMAQNEVEQDTNVVQHRSELLFLYDIRDANPNGDPADENKPRIDEETGVNIVTDVRLKRTIRDYLYEYRRDEAGEIFVRKVESQEGIQDAKARAKDFKNDPSEILRSCIDVRMFGGTLPISTGASKDSSITFTGPVQFKMGRSLHTVELKYIKGTAAFASKEGKQQKSFREEYILPYSLICFYGIINENAAKKTNLTERDVKLLLDAMWNGTKNLITRTKVGQTPRLLLKVTYKDSGYHIGDLDKLIELQTSVPHEKLRDISQLSLDITNLVNTLRKHKDKIKSVEYLVDDRLNLMCNGEKAELSSIEDIEATMIEL